MTKGSRASVGRSPARGSRSAAGRSRVAEERRPLFDMIEERARTQGRALTRLTREEFGIGFSYYAALKSGAGKIEHSMDFLKRCAAYLDIPLFHVLIHAG